MPPLQIVANATGLILFGTTIVFAISGNFLLRKAEVSVFGFILSNKDAFIVLGPLLIIVNSAIFVFCAMLYFSDVSNDEIAIIKSKQTYWILGPIFNPFFISSSNIINSFGYAFLIILWWFGMQCFWYSAKLDDPSPFTQAWSYLIGGLYLVVGLMSMLAIQGCWAKFGLEQYRLKQIGGFVGIPIGAFLPPLLFRLDLPQHAARLWSLIRSSFQ